ncbi:RNA polymerase II mediator complex component Med8 [Drepanopeziza brunnea f. sp. 'multigermtubi' MB_m1]|uniref:Mediator of RNA polymerase II transcription subunit 8 n=1 Tax=Marssonina brunnea f. sp. multigermtubi (strain MB_m1) TaxID=1072389 RepID=K1WWH9_MARBU|nr:RNA polymerase II mediator complex component Med8 [Drepanopeziza brunnea f. sp. 'multigermtubi' MB_m1]EKD16857.1 RNA polymerase II mediator complex component Med8 [Drepanopeziza brunnea f. sp. 'multigermtubi' MB_m1]
MAQAAMNQEDIKALEQLRQRFFNLANNIASLKQDVLRSNPLPPWSSLQTSASILASNIESITNLMSKNADLLNRTVVYPSTNFPGRTQEGILTQLLRKKMEPQVETWVEEGRTTHAEVTEGGTDAKAEEELLDWAKNWLGGRVARYVINEAGDNYTFEERELGIENVNTGLRRKLEEGDSARSRSRSRSRSGSGSEDEEDAGTAVTAVRRSSIGEVESGLGPLRKDPNGKNRNIEDILRFGVGGAVLEGRR